MRGRILTLVVAGALALAACGGNGDDGNGATDGGEATVSVTGTDALAFQPDQLSAEAGSITVELTSEETVEHTFLVEEAGDTLVVRTPAGQTETGTIELEAGTYTFYCDVPGHREAGMEGTLEVE